MQTFSDKEFHQIGFEALRLAINALNELGIKWWLEAGSCLGAVREGDFIGHDTDIDFGIIATEEQSKALLEYLDSRGLEKLTSKINGLKYEFGAVYKDTVKLDFFNFYEDGEILWHRAGDVDYQRYEFSKELFEDLMPIIFLGLKCFVPNPPEQYLAERYGDWHIPNKRWSWESSPCCIRKIK